MVSDIELLEDEDDPIPHTPYSLTPSPIYAGGDDYFSSSTSKISRPSNHRRESSNRSIMTTRTRQASYSSRSPGTVMGRKNEEEDTPIRVRKERPRKPLERLHTEVLLRMVLQDAQTRLVFRAQAMLISEVEYYAPKDGDLNYPEKLGSGELIVWHKS